jgi:hypothetical protein
MYELHLRYLEAGRVREASTPPAAAEVSLLARCLSRRRACARPEAPARPERPPVARLRPQEAPS